MATQAIVQISKYDIEGYVRGISIVQAPIPEPPAGQALVRISLRPVNPADAFSVQGIYPGFTPATLPAVPGLEGTGVVAKLGEGCSRVAVGDKVIAWEWGTKVGNGTWQQYVAINEENLVVVPEGVTEEQAAMALVNPVTVVGMVDTLAVPAGEWLLLSAAGSALGRLVAKYAKRSGVKVVGTVRRRDQVEELLAEGFDAVVCTADADVLDQIKKVTGDKGAFGALDSIAGASTALCTGALRNGGTVIVYGAMEGVEFKGSVIDVLFRDIHIRGFWLVPYLHALPVPERQAFMEKVLHLSKEGVFPAFVGKVFPLEEASNAILEATSAGRGGKVLLRG